VRTDVTSKRIAAGEVAAGEAAAGEAAADGVASHRGPSGGPSGGPCGGPCGRTFPESVLEAYGEHLKEKDWEWLHRYPLSKYHEGLPEDARS